MSEPQLPLRILLGATLNREFTLKDRATGAAINLTGWTPSLIITRQSGGSTLLEITTSNGLTIPTPSNGKLVLSYFAPASGFTLAVGEYWYRMRLVASATNVWALWPGPLTVATQ
jgi:hypothetical protein